MDTSDGADASNGEDTSDDWDSSDDDDMNDGDHSIGDGIPSRSSGSSSSSVNFLVRLL